MIREAIMLTKTQRHLAIPAVAIEALLSHMIRSNTYYLTKGKFDGIAESFVGKIGDQKHESITIVEEASHTAGWRKAWPLLINATLYKRDH